MEKSEVYEVPNEEEMVNDMEALEQGLPFEDYEKDEQRLRELVKRLEKQYDRREKVIQRIVEFGTGIESEKALRMYSTPILEKWEASLDNFRAEKLKKK
jgi:hypothetical protein